jgi:hypothetical protein
MSQGAQNMKMGHDDLGTAGNDFGSIKHESGTRRPGKRRSRILVRKTRKRDPDALGTAENEFGSAKHENGTRRPKYR